LSVISYTIIKTKIGRVGVAESPIGLCALHVNCKAYDEFAEYLKEIFPKEEFIKISQSKCKCADEVIALIENPKLKCKIPLDIRGTEFQKSVWNEMLKIPCGKTVTYKYIAEKIKKPKAVRAVGTACGANRIPVIIPCHRVVGSSGIGGYSGGLDIKLKLLKNEAI